MDRNCIVPAKNSNDPAAQLAKAVEQLTRIAKVLAMAVVKGQQQREQISFLRAVGYSPMEIGEILGTTANTVSVTLLQLKKQRRIRKK